MGTVISIPYRQTQNFTSPPQKGHGNNYFNSLQVDSKPMETTGIFIATFLFQFLIGRLKTTHTCRTIQRYHIFQFLIGRLKTCYRRQINRRQTFISIPYRQTQNRPGGRLFCCHHIISIPYRQTQNPVHVLGFLLREFKISIPYRQTQNPVLHKGLSLHSDISIPYRQTQNNNYELYVIADAILFQFLIGRLKTSWIAVLIPFDYAIISIPYRQTQNFCICYSVRRSFRISIPYRQTQNAIISASTSAGLWISIPYRQTQNS